MRNHGPSVEDKNFLSYVCENNKSAPYSSCMRKEEVTLIQYLVGFKFIVHEISKGNS
jgi:hypothetical protein